MYCKFCNIEKPLIRAHIIPDAFYKQLTPKKGHLLGIKDGSVKPDLLQAGVYDTNILCQNCDNHIFGKWDKYAIEFFRRRNEWHKIEFSEDSSFGYYEIISYDYKILKLFFMSVLWRMAISDKYLNVRLGKY